MYFCNFQKQFLNKSRCVKYAGDHKTEGFKKNKFKKDVLCCNCGGRHLTSFKGCYKDKHQYLKTTQNLTPQRKNITYKIEKAIRSPKIWSLKKLPLIEKIILKKLEQIIKKVKILRMY